MQLLPDHVNRRPNGRFLGGLVFDGEPGAVVTKE